MKDFIKAACTSSAQVFFADSRRLGALLLAVSWISPSVGAGAVSAMAGAYFLSKMIRQEKAFLGAGFYLYNPLLVGLSIGYMFGFNRFMPTFALLGGMMTYLVTVITHSLFSLYLKLPVFSVPFVLVSMMVYMAAHSTGQPLVGGMASFPQGLFDPYVPQWISGYFKSLGGIFFIPDILAGLMIGISILLLD